jgi:hypothetical protein
LASPETRFFASLSNATQLPSAEMAGYQLYEFASFPAESTLTRSVIPFARSRTKMSNAEFLSFATRSNAPL